jgi:drug/metabolite transporter (DMT)-like permease
MANKIHTQVTRRKAILGFSLAFLAAVGFSAKAILVKLAYAYPVDAISLLALRMLFSAPIFLLVAVRHLFKHNQPRLTAKDYLALLFLGISGYYLSSLFDFIGLQNISASLERLILFLYPTFVVVLSALFLHKPFGRKEILALLISYAGITVVFFEQLNIHVEHLYLGAGFVFASTLTYAFYLIGTGEFVAKIGASRFTAYAMLIASSATLAQFFYQHPVQNLYLPCKVYEYAFYMAVFSTVLPVFMLSAAIRLIGSSHTSLIGSIGPVATLGMASLFLGEQLTTLQIIGAGLVILGVFSLTIK